MSTTVEIKKDIEITFQIDRLACNNCGAELTHEVTTDGFGDIEITVDPCECILEDQ